MLDGVSVLTFEGLLLFFALVIPIEPALFVVRIGVEQMGILPKLVKPASASLFPAVASVFKAQAEARAEMAKAWAEFAKAADPQTRGMAAMGLFALGMTEKAYRLETPKDDVLAKSQGSFI